MKWVDSDTSLPVDKQEVLIRNNRIHHIAVFDAKEACFILRDESKIRVCDEKLQWMPIVPPVDESR